MDRHILPQGKFLVSVRIRPLNEKEVVRGEDVDWECINDKTILYKNTAFCPDRSMCPSFYSFDRVFESNCSTRQVYQEGAKSIALSAVAGINASIFAYGQTSSGKTYTMTGITEYAMIDIFDHIHKHTQRQFILKFSAMEIYNESVRDLLSVDTTPLRLRDDPERGTIVDKLTEEVVHDLNHVQELISVCKAQRQIAETILNESSSRSHQIIKLTIESHTREVFSKDSLNTLVATVNFIDLAGSERASQVLSLGTKLKEGSHINRSLLALGTVIRKLSKERNGHVPYRDSKLTRILQSSLSGNTRTAIICTMSPARSYVEQSRNTLLFATSAKQVASTPKVNIEDTDKALVKHMQRKLSTLENELRDAGSSFEFDSTSILRDKDLLIGKLQRQVKELTLQRDLALSQIQNVQFEESVNAPYPKLHVRRQSWTSQMSHVSSATDLHSIDSSAVAWETSRPCSRRSFSLCDESSVYSDFDDDFLPRIVAHPAPFESPPRLFIRTPVGQEAEREKEFNINNTSIDFEESIMSDIETNSISLEQSKKTLPLKIDCGTQMEDHELPSSWYQIDDVNVDENYNSPSLQPEVEKLEIHVHQNKQSLESTDKIDDVNNKLYGLGDDDDAFNEMLSEKMMVTRYPSTCISREAKAPEPKFCTEEVDPNGDSHDAKIKEANEMLSEKMMVTKYPSTCISREAQAPEPKVLTKEVDPNGDSHDAEIKEATNVQCTKEVALLMEKDVSPKADTFIKNVKDVGFQYDLETEQWPLDFDKLRKEVVDLWDICNVSLLYRTSFFLLFEGDPGDSIYMEVERRRLWFIKDAFAWGNETVLDGQIISPSLSKKHMQQERNMLSKMLKSRISQQEREALYVKWGIHLDTKKRSSQLAHQLWTRPQSMEHVRESASVVSLLIKFDKSQVRKEMFGLNLMPALKGVGSHGWLL